MNPGEPPASVCSMQWCEPLTSVRPTAGAERLAHRKVSVPEGQEDISPGSGVPGTRSLRVGVEDQPEAQRRAQPGVRNQK